MTSSVPAFGRAGVAACAPAVSIVLPARNAASTLPAALRSIARQTFADWELVAVDDGSADETGSLLRAAAAADRRVVVVDGPARGLVPALCAGCRWPALPSSPEWTPMT